MKWFRPDSDSDYSGPIYVALRLGGENIVDVGHRKDGKVIYVNRVGNMAIWMYAWQPIQQIKTPGFPKKREP